MATPFDLTLYLSRDAVKYFATGARDNDTSPLELELQRALKLAARRQMPHAGDPKLIRIELPESAVYALIDDPYISSSSVHQHALRRACRRTSEITINPPCYLCGGVNASQFFMEGFWAHDCCMDEYVDQRLAA